MRKVSFVASLILTVVLGLVFGACVPATCPPLGSIPLMDGLFVDDSFESAGRSFGALVIDPAGGPGNPLEVEVDTTAMEVTMRFRNEGRAVVERFAITSTSTP
ncbi:MAG: hypothetical protein K8H88_21760 [Sandaracinaceae bacterium]|nr:hypothetical protein [Sandaracinaceae bacterium]